MIAHFYRLPQPGTLFMIPFFAAISLLPSFFLPVHESAETVTFVSKLIWNWVSELHPWAVFAMSVALVSTQAIYLNNIVNYHELIYRQTNLPSFFLVVFTVLIPGVTQLNPALVAGVFALLMLDRLYLLHKHSSPVRMLFDMGVFVACATILYPPFIVLLILLLAGQIMLRPFSWRETMSSVSGILVTYFLLFTVLYVTHNFSPENLFGTVQNSFAISGFIRLPVPLLILLMVVGVVLFLSLIKMASEINRNIIRTRNYQKVIFWFLLLSTGIYLWQGKPDSMHYYVIVIPSSVVTGYYFLAVKRIWYLEFLLMIMVGASAYYYRYLWLLS